MLQYVDMGLNDEDSFSHWLLEEFEARGLSYSEVARRGGISHARISQVIGGDKPGKRFCKSIAKALDYPDVVVFRKAGILPPAQEEDAEYWQELRHYLGQLSYRDRIRVIQMVKGWAAEAQLEEEGIIDK